MSTFESRAALVRRAMAFRAGDSGEYGKGIAVDSRQLIALNHEMAQAIIDLDEELTRKEHAMLALSADALGGRE